MKTPWFAIAALAAITLSQPSVAAADESQGIQFSGDIRGRLESFDFKKDATGGEKESRTRLRYRFRLNLKATANEYAWATIQLTTGDTDSRSTNQTLGSPVDFGPNEFDVRKAFVTVSPFKQGKLPGDRKGSMVFNIGRMSNPMIWKNGVDKMLWDGDFALGGVNTVIKLEASESVHLFANAGYYTLDENSSAEDPYFVSGQAGVIAKVAENLEAGARGTYYHFDKLDAAFVQRGVDGTGGSTSAKGNIIDGLTGDAAGGTLDVIEGQGFLTLAGSEDWPVTVYGGASVNSSAAASDSLPGAGAEDFAYNGGGEIGSKKKFVKLGAAYYYIEANAFPSQFIDSDILDGVTNRKGVMAYLSRVLVKNTDVNLTLFFSDVIDDTLTAVSGSKRTRGQLDLVVKF